MTEATVVHAPISGVTVFRDGARITRLGGVALPAGSSLVSLGGLPWSLDPASVRVTVRGEGVALLEVAVENGYEADPQLENLAQLEAEVEDRRQEVAEIADDDTAVGARLAYLGRLSKSAARALAGAVSFGRRPIEDLSQMADRLAEDTAAALARRRELTRRRREADRRLEAAEKRLEQAGRRHGGAVQVYEVRAGVDAEAAVEAEVEITYHVQEGSWRPLYDLRLDGDRLAVSYLAEITQSSGEDWPAGELSLSTTRRGRHTRLPELEPWYIGRDNPPTFAKARLAGAAGPEQADLEAFAAPQALAAGAVAPAALPAPAFLSAEVLVAGAALVYKVARPLAVPSDGQPHKVTVKRFELEAALDHLTVPKLAPEAYLRATVTNTSPLILLPGPANVFHGAEFVGSTSIETVAPGEELEVQLGVDEHVRVERELRRKAASKAIIGSTRSIDTSYEISLENHSGRPATVTVCDNIPTSRDAEVKVRLREAAPKPTEQDELGELTWRLELAAGAKATIVLAFTVDHPAGARLYGI